MTKNCELQERELETTGKKTELTEQPEKAMKSEGLYLETYQKFYTIWKLKCLL